MKEGLKDEGEGRSVSVREVEVEVTIRVRGGDGDDGPGGALMREARQVRGAAIERGAVASGFRLGEDGSLRFEYRPEGGLVRREVG